MLSNGTKVHLLMNKLVIFCVPDKEEIEEVWRQSWTVLDLVLKVSSNTNLGLDLKDVR